MVLGLGDGDDKFTYAAGTHIDIGDFAALAKSTAVLQEFQVPPAHRIARATLLARVRETAAFVRVAGRVDGGALSAGAGASLRAEIDEYCGTPPRPHHVAEALLTMSLVAASLTEKDGAKAFLVGEVERLQKSAGAR